MKFTDVKRPHFRIMSQGVDGSTICNLKTQEAESVELTLVLCQPPKRAAVL